MNKSGSIPSSVWITLALIAASIEPIVAKFAYKDGVDAVQLIMLKNVLGGLFVLPILYSKRRIKGSSSASTAAHAANSTNSAAGSGATAHTADSAKLAADSATTVHAAHSTSSSADSASTAHSTNSSAHSATTINASSNSTVANWSNVELFKRLGPVGLLLFTTNSLTLYSLKSLSVVLLITIVTCVPALVGVLNNVMGRDALSRKFWIGFCMCFAGVICTLDYKDILVNWLGVSCAMAAAISSSIYRVRMEILCEEHTPMIAAAFTYMVQGLASLVYLPWALPMAGTAIMFGGWIGLSAALANLAFVYALNLVGSTRISVLTMVQRPLLIIAACVTLHETVSIVQAIGIALVMAGIQLAQVTRLSTASKTMASK